jgi:hypothetical protein
MSKLQLIGIVVLLLISLGHAIMAVMCWWFEDSLQMSIAITDATVAAMLAMMGFQDFQIKDLQTQITQHEERINEIEGDLQ